MCYNEYVKISVIIPVYNEQQYLTNCLEALRAQTYPADEIIIVDNNSTDRSHAIAESFKVTIINEPRQGMIFARNSGFDSAQGDIIARCDADALPKPQWIQRITENFDAFPIDALSGPIHLYDFPVFSIFWSKVYAWYVSSRRQGKSILIGPNMALKKELWNRIRLHVCLQDNAVHEDVDLALHIQEAGGRIFFDRNLIMEVSGRRIKSDPLSFFFEYPQRLQKTLRAH